MSDMSPLPVSLNFMPSFYNKHLGLVYGEPYYFEPEYRAEIECAEARFLHEVLGRFGVGSPAPAPSPSLFIQPIDLLKITQGAEIHCPEDATLETWGHPWANLNPDEIASIDAADAARHPIVDALLRQYGEMQDLYGERADVFGINAGTMGIHTPYTTAHQLCGEALFLLIMDDLAGTQQILAKVWEIYTAVFGRLRNELGAPPPSRLHLGDCSASLLSADVYRDGVLPMNRTLAAGFPEIGYHSCGASSHLVQAFAEIPGVTSIELGPGTDLAAAVQSLPNVSMRPLIDPVLMRNATPTEVEQTVSDVLTATASAPDTLLCAWSFDRDTPITNVERLYETVQAWTAVHPEGSEA